MNRRNKLSNHQREIVLFPTMSAEESFALFVLEISQKKNIVVLAGAGISVSCGIPDFRSHDGLYNTLNYQVGDAQ